MPAGHREPERDDLGDDDQLDRHRQALGDHRRDALARAVGAAEVAGQRVADPVDVANHQRPLEAELGAQRLDLGFRRGIAEDRDRGVARQDFGDRKGERRRREDDRDERQELGPDAARGLRADHLSFQAECMRKQAVRDGRDALHRRIGERDVVEVVQSNRYGSSFASRLLICAIDLHPLGLVGGGAAGIEQLVHFRVVEVAMRLTVPLEWKNWCTFLSGSAPPAQR